MIFTVTAPNILSADQSDRMQTSANHEPSQFSNNNNKNLTFITDTALATSSRNTSVVERRVLSNPSNHLVNRSTVSAYMTCDPRAAETIRFLSENCWGRSWRRISC